MVISEAQLEGAEQTLMNLLKEKDVEVKSLKDQLQKIQEAFEEGRQIIDKQKTQLHEREEEAESLRDEGSHLKEEFEKLQAQQRTSEKFNKGTKVLETTRRKIIISKGKALEDSLHKEGHSPQEIKLSFLAFVTLVIILDIRLSIVVFLVR